MPEPLFNINSEESHILKDVLTPKEKWATNAFWVVLAATLLLSIFIFWRTWWFPVTPPEISSLNLDDGAKRIAQYKELSQIGSQSLSNQFDLIVGKALLPLLTTLLGYIIGRGKKS